MAKGRKTGGRRPGSRNKHTPEIRQLARKHTVAVVKRLAELAKGDNLPVAAQACKELLDRGWGRPAQHIDLTGNVTLVDFFQAMALAASGVIEGSVEQDEDNHALPKVPLLGQKRGS